MHACMHSFMHACMHSFIHSFMHACMHAFIHPSIHSCIHSFIHPFIRSFVHSFIRSFVHSFIRSFVHSFMHAFILSFFLSFLAIIHTPNTEVPSNFLWFSLSSVFLSHSTLSNLAVWNYPPKTDLLFINETHLHHQACFYPADFHKMYLYQIYLYQNIKHTSVKFVSIKFTCMKLFSTERPCSEHTTSSCSVVAKDAWFSRAWDCPLQGRTYSILALVWTMSRMHLKNLTICKCEQGC